MAKKIMVNQQYLFKVSNLLEQYLLSLKNYRFDGDGFQMIIFSEKNRGQIQRFDLIFSAKAFDELPKKVAIKGTYEWLKSHLDSNIIRLIESIIVVDTRSSFTKNVGYNLSSQDEIIEHHYVQIGGAKIDHGYVVRSNIVNRLEVGQALTATLFDGEIINMGIKSIDQKLNIVFYTGKGLRELFPRSNDPIKRDNAMRLKEMGDDYLISEFYINSINISEIRSLR